MGRFRSVATLQLTKLIPYKVEHYLALLHLSEKENTMTKQLHQTSGASQEYSRNCTTSLRTAMLMAAVSTQSTTAIACLSRRRNHPLGRMELREMINEALKIIEDDESDCDD